MLCSDGHKRHSPLRAALPPLVLQRRISRFTSPALSFLFSSCGMARLGSRVALLAPARPAHDFLFVPTSKVEQAPQHGSDFRHSELWMFFFPTAVFAA
jgi:hypothetical protein